ncbi:MAG: insulinase family protein [Clostridia bacterium]|nr:insulinase family protein [Clostridia bacterium]
MEWTMETALCGFRVTRIRENQKIGGRLIEMTHEATGALLCWVQNGAENKLFSVAFKTIPEDDTGVFHILEHSVLCGSEKFPVREPFLELLKSSMNTFLNAMTYPDKTVYPVSSRNTQDFLNLTEVYLDAVFAPRLLTDENIFRQEGRRLELTDDGGALNGVVLNEMKGAMSGVDDRIGMGIDRLLFPDTCYRFNSGGDPAAIPTLTYADFKAAYRRFYHPSNARFFLDGDVPIEATLAMIDRYLSRFERSPASADVTWQAPHGGEATAYYAVDKDEPNRDHLAFAKLLGRFDDTDRLLAARVLCSLLTATNESPLKRALLSKGLCEDVDLYVNDEIAQPSLVLAVRNTNAEREGEIRDTIRTVIRDLCAAGLSKDLLTAYLNQLEFSTRQLPEPQGLVRATAALSYWLYGGDPLEPLDVDENFKRLRGMIETGGFDALLQSVFADNGDVVTLRMLPSLTLEGEEAQAEADRVRAYLDTLTPQDRDTLKAKNAALQLWQQTEDSPEALATIPTLTLSQVEPEPKLIETQTQTSGPVTALLHPMHTNGIVYLNLYFPLSGFTLEELELVSVIPSFFTDLPTAAHSVAALQQEIKTRIGRLRFDVTATEIVGDPAHCMPYLTVSAGILEENLERAEALIAEILTQTLFEDTDKMLEILRQIDDGNRQAAITSGHTLAIGAVRAGYTACGAVREAFGGVPMIRRVRALVQDFASQKAALDDIIGRVCAQIGKASLTLSVTAQQPEVPATLLGLLPEGTPQAAVPAYHKEQPGRIGVRIPAPVAFAVKGFHPSLIGKTADGALSVLANMVTYSYLWNRVRVQGGAYGAGLTGAGRSGMYCYSYRDPNPAASLGAYDGVADFLEAFLAGDEAPDKYIISSVAASDPLQSPGNAALTADERYFAGITDDWLRRRRQEMLAADRAALGAWLDALHAMKDRGGVCVVGGERALTDCGNLEIIAL